MKNFIERYLKIYSHELSRFIWMGAIFLAVFYVTAIFRNYVDAAFLKRYGPDYIPWMMLISAVLTMAVLAGADRIAKRFSDSVLLAGFLAVYAAAAVACFFMVKAGVSLVYPILYQLMGLLDAILLVYLWNMAGDLFDARQGKRIFPLITAAQVLGATFGSFSTKPITNAVGYDAALLIFGAVFIMTSLFIFRTAAGVMEDRPCAARPAKKLSAIGRLRDVPVLMRRFPIIRFLIIGGLIPNILLPIFSYQFSVICNHSFSSEESLISFLSLFRGCSTITTFVILLFAGRMYSQMGLPNASLAHPVNFTLIFGSLATFFNVYVAAYGQFTVVLVQRAIAGPVNKILFNVIPLEWRSWARSFVSGTVLKVGMMTGSMAMILLKPVLNAQSYAYIGVALAGCWVAETLAFRKEYKRVLKQVILEGKVDFAAVEAARTFDAGGAPIGLESTAEYRQSGAGPGRNGTVRARWTRERAIALLDDPEPGVRAEAALFFIGNPDLRAVRRLVDRLEDYNDKARSAAIEALLTYPSAILPFLEASLLNCGMRGKLGILEVIRMSPDFKEFEMTRLFKRSVEEAYENLLVIMRLGALNRTRSIEMLKGHLMSRNDDILRLLFYSLWVYHADMRLMYQALKSDSTAIAVEMVENTVPRDKLPYLLPLIDDMPLEEKVEKGKKLFNFVERTGVERMLTMLSQSSDSVTRLLCLMVMSDLMPNPALIPVIDSYTDDEDAVVREMARFALAIGGGEEAQMPEIIDVVEKLKGFAVFEGLGTRELLAIASVLKTETLKAGDIVVRPGEENRSIYLLISGRIEIYSHYGTPEQRMVFVSEAGGYWGFVPMFADSPPANTSVATEETEVLVLPQNQFQEILRVYPAIALNMLRMAAMRFHGMGITA
jgi:ATP/ADP translocase